MNLKDLKFIQKELHEAYEMNDKILIGYAINRLDTLIFEETQQLQEGNVANVISVTADADLCDVNGCGAESSTGGCEWTDTGYWSLCSYHTSQARKGSPQPVMKQSAIAREKSRDPISGLLP